MYDRPETAAANDALWRAIRKHLGFGPSNLSRDVEGLDHWLSPELVFSQTCGMPYRLHLHGKVKLIGSPVWALDGLAPGHYFSVIICHADSAIASLEDCAGKRFACNMALSQSGWAAAETEALARGFSFTNVLETGAHLASAKAVAKGQAMVAAIDVITWELMIRHEPDLISQLKVIHETAPTPTLPYITSIGQDDDQLFEAVAAAIDGLPSETRNRLCLRGITRVPAEDYRAIPSPAFPRVTGH